MYWSAALDGYAHHPLLGSGAGTFEQLWLLYRPTRIYNVLDAHNAYLEVLAELGPFGVFLFAAAVAVPLLALRRRPRTPLVAGAAGAYAAYAAHIAIDWDWEIPAVTVVALLCGSVLVAGARRVALGPARRSAAFAAALGVAALSLAGLLANGALWEGNSALQRGDFARARAEAATAERWDLWSVEPEQLRAETELAAGNRRVAAAVLRRAVRREPNSYWLWADLAGATTGHERRAAIQRAESLNPLELPLSAGGRGGTGQTG
jgi:4-amino-4-deoxy-L-arabinose transferase-like glycosyltransferase